MPLINDLLTELFGPYQKYEALTLTHAYKKDRASYFLVRNK